MVTFTPSDAGSITWGTPSVPTEGDNRLVCALVWGRDSFKLRAAGECHTNRQPCFHAGLWPQTLLLWPFVDICRADVNLQVNNAAKVTPQDLWLTTPEDAHNMYRWSKKHFFFKTCDQEFLSQKKLVVWHHFLFCLFLSARLPLNLQYTFKFSQRMTPKDFVSPLTFIWRPHYRVKM